MTDSNVVPFMPRANQAANRSFYMGPRALPDHVARLRGTLRSKPAPDDLVMGHADPEMTFPDSGDCA